MADLRGAIASRRESRPDSVTPDQWEATLEFFDEDLQAFEVVLQLYVQHLLRKVHAAA